MPSLVLTIFYNQCGDDYKEVHFKKLGLITIVPTKQEKETDSNLLS